MKDYVIAIPSYKRSVEITTKTLPLYLSIFSTFRKVFHYQVLQN